ncbi:DUF2256 domain-containing protein [Novosphingobium lentum]
MVLALVLWSTSDEPIREGRLPSKECLACGRPFAWRKKWARD